MPKYIRSRSVILPAGAAVIAIAAALFVYAMSIGDFGQPDGGFLSGRSNAVLAIAFILLAGLAAALLVALAGARGVREKDAGPGKARTAEGAPPAADRPEAPGRKPGGILSETAGELRTSVEVIEVELEEMLDDEAPADRDRVHVLYEETDRLKKIIDGMEQLSRARAIAQASRKEVLPVEPLMKEIIDRTRTASGSKDITYRLECEAGLVLKGDAECIGRIIGNIMDNAARFIMETGTVTLSAGRRGGTAVFSVTDTGPGIRRTHLPHLYEHFFRGAGTGIGIGLSVAKELTDALGGKIDVRTSAGKGTTVTVELPAE